VSTPVSSVPNARRKLSMPLLGPRNQTPERIAMLATEALTDAPPSDWSTFDEGYAEFVRQYPELGLVPSRWGAARARARYGAALVARDAARRVGGKTGSLIAHRHRFAPAMFELVTLGSKATWRSHDPALSER